MTDKKQIDREALKLANNDFREGAKAATDLLAIARNDLELNPRQAFVAFGLAFAVVSRYLEIEDANSVEVIIEIFNMVDEHITLVPNDGNMH